MFITFVHTIPYIFAHIHARLYVRKIPKP